MIRITGQVANVFVTKRSEIDGERRGGDHKIQILGEFPSEDQTVRLQLVDLKVKDAKPYQALKGKKVSVPVGAFSPAKGSVVFFVVGNPETATQ